MIKPVKSVNAKAKKLYMLYNLTPAKELTGGPWYTELEFDHEFISELRTFLMHCVESSSENEHGEAIFVAARRVTPMCEFKCKYPYMQDYQI